MYIQSIHISSSAPNTTHIATVEPNSRKVQPAVSTHVAGCKRSKELATPAQKEKYK